MSQMAPSAEFPSSIFFFSLFCFLSHTGELAMSQMAPSAEFTYVPDMQPVVTVTRV